MDKPKEAFKDEQFLESPEGRSIRILSEYEKVKNTIMLIYVIVLKIIIVKFRI